MRQLVTTSRSADRRAYSLVVELMTGRKAGDSVHPGLRYATNVVRVSGPQWGYGFVGIPVRTFGYESAPAVALAADGPSGTVKLRSRAKIAMQDADGKSVPLLVGYIVQYSHSVDDDSIVATVVDDRWLLHKLTCFGRATYDPITKKHWFDAGKALVFGEGGYPDCLDTPYGPRFAPGRMFGYCPSDSDAFTTEPPPGRATNRARTWRCSDVVAYLRSNYYETSTRPSHPCGYGQEAVSQYVSWPESFGQQNGFDRWVRKLSCENQTLAAALQSVARRAGPWDLYVRPSGWLGELCMVRMDDRPGGIKLVGPTYGNATIYDALADHTRVSGGTVTESIVNYFDDVCIAGDPPAIERMVSMTGHGSTAFGSLTLVKAWSDDDETGFKAVLDANGNNDDAFQIACSAFPDVYCSYRIDPRVGQDPFIVSHWGDETTIPTFPRILSTLLSGYSEGNQNPRNFSPREISVEYWSVDDSAWRACARFDGLELTNDGTTLRMDSLRRNDMVTMVRTNGWQTSGISAAPIRLTCAFEREFRITGKAAGDPNQTSSRVNGMDRFTFLAVADGQDYVHWERYNSRPNGTNCNEPYKSQNFPDQCGDQYLFSDLLGYGGESRIERHSQRRLNDVKRVEHSGELTLHTWNPGLSPGDGVTFSVGDRDIPCNGVIKCVTLNSTTQSQTVEIASSDNSVIYDVPLPIVSSSRGGSPSPTSSGSSPSTAPNTGNPTDVQRTMDYSSYQQSGSVDASQTRGVQQQQSVTPIAPKPIPPSAAENRARRIESLSDREGSGSNEYLQWLRSADAAKNDVTADRRRSEMISNDARNTIDAALSGRRISSTKKASPKMEDEYE